MQAHLITTHTNERHEVVIQLPEDFPGGEVDVIVSPRSALGQAKPTERLARLQHLLAALPEVPSLPLDAFDRGTLYP